MSNSSESFFSSIGLSIDQQGLSTLTNDQLSSNANNTSDNDRISILNHYGILSIEGADAAKFLQGQTSCDVDAISDDLSSLGSLSTPKGRVLSNFHLARTSSSNYLLRMDKSIVENTKNILSKYIVFSKAEQSIKDDYIVIGLSGEQAKANIQSAFGQTPKAKLACVHLDDCIAIQLDNDGNLFECWMNANSIADVWPHLSDKLTLSGERFWQHLTIVRGIAEISLHTTDMFIPQMLNLHTIGAVSFTKGCYTGQEVIARMQYKGKLKRTLYRIRMLGDCSKLSLGTELYPRPTDSAANSPQSVGNLVNIVQLPDNSYEALAVIASKNVDENNLVIGNQGLSLEILSLPYAISNS